MKPRFGILLLFATAMTGPLRAEDPRPVVDDAQIPKEEPKAALRTLWLAGDSTVKNQGAMRGWGQELAAHLDPAKIQVVNRAIGGRSARTFFTEGRWDDMLGAMKAGDIVLVQFGHNDAGPLDARGKFRGSVKGTGEATEQVTKPDGSVETVHSYGWYLRHFARTAKTKGVTVALCSPVPHKKFDREGRFVPGWTEWRTWVEESARAEGVHFLDLAGRIGRRYAALPVSEVEGFFADARTHTNATGAKFSARVVAAALREIPGHPPDGAVPAPESATP